jgi:hypothetical protein
MEIELLWTQLLLSRVIQGIHGYFSWTKQDKIVTIGKMATLYHVQ